MRQCHCTSSDSRAGYRIRCILLEPLRIRRAILAPQRTVRTVRTKKTAPEGADNLTREKTTALLPLHTSEEDQRV
jgi:hypothetical protein